MQGRIQDFFKGGSNLQSGVVGFDLLLYLIISIFFLLIFLKILHEGNNFVSKGGGGEFERTPLISITEMYSLLF